jgi:hypothetical protein
LQLHYRFNVTPLDVIESAWVTPPSAVRGVRGPTISTVQESSRAQKRAELAQQQRRDRTDEPRRSSSALKPALIGAGSAVAVLGIAAVVFALMGGL